MILNEQIKNCLQLAMEDSELSLEDTVDTGIMMYADLVGTVTELMDEDEEGEEFVRACYMHVSDLVLESLILKGVMEPSSIDENGEILFGFVGLEKEEGNNV